jgi:hypothetical protein
MKLAFILGPTGYEYAFRGMPLDLTCTQQHLTSLSTESVVAELGWTRKAIQTVLGVTPTIMRPPYGDIGTFIFAPAPRR